MSRLVGLLVGLVLIGLVSVAYGQTPPGPSPEQVVIPAAPAGTPATGQISVGATATLIRVANAKRTSIVVVNHGSTNVFIAFTNGVTTVGGVMLVGIPGSSLTFQTRTDVWAITASGSQTVSFSEETRP
jgi:hypothetical protein